MFALFCELVAKYFIISFCNIIPHLSIKTNCCSIMLVDLLFYKPCVVGITILRIMWVEREPCLLPIQVKVVSFSQLDICALVCCFFCIESNLFLPHILCCLCCLCCLCYVCCLCCLCCVCLPGPPAHSHVPKVCHSLSILP